jgi:hypothetical protein
MFKKLDLVGACSSSWSINVTSSILRYRVSGHFCFGFDHLFQQSRKLVIETNTATREKPIFSRANLYLPKYTASPPARPYLDDFVARILSLAPEDKALSKKPQVLFSHHLSLVSLSHTFQVIGQILNTVARLRDLVTHLYDNVPGVPAEAKDYLELMIQVFFLSFL